MRALCIIPCGRSKIWEVQPCAGPTEARYAYTGLFFSKCRAYAEKFYPHSWYILSAKYGFVAPGDIIPGPYNVSFNDPSTNPIDIRQLVLQAQEKELLTYGHIIALGGKHYISIIQRVFQGKQIETPLAGCKGIGYMMEKLNKDLMR